MQCGHRALALVLRAHLLGRRGRLRNVAKLLCFPREQKKMPAQVNTFLGPRSQERVCVPGVLCGTQGDRVEVARTTRDLAVAVVTDDLTAFGCEPG